MLRRAAGVAGMVAGVLLLSGCAAIDLPLAGVRVAADGTPHALIRPCGDDAYMNPSLDGWAGASDDGPSSTGWEVKRENLGGDADFPLFSPPTAWKARHRGARRLLPRHHYSLVFAHYITGDSYNGIADFSTEDIAKLKPGQVWADGRAMSRGKFEKLAAAAC